MEVVTQVTWKASTGLWQGLGLAAPRGWVHTFLGDPPHQMQQSPHSGQGSPPCLVSARSVCIVGVGPGVDMEGGAVQSVALSPGPAGSPEFGKGDRKNLGEREYKQTATLQKAMETGLWRCSDQQLSADCGVAEARCKFPFQSENSPWRYQPAVILITV